MFLPFEALHPEQHDALDCLERNSIVFLTGPSGCAKTYLATHHAISLALDPDSVIKKIYLTRPAIVMGKEIGFIPGDLKEKMSPFTRPILNAYKKQLSHDKKLIANLERMIEHLPIGYLRGWTIEGAILLIDEAQNLTGKEIKSALTRIGKNGKIVFCGDIEQSDLNYSVLEKAARDLDGVSKKGRRIGWHSFSKESIVRDPLVSTIIDIADRSDWAQ